MRLPFFHGQEQPGASYLHQVFSYFGPIAHVEQVDSKGGFVVTLAASLDTALQTAHILAANFQGRANLNGDPACIQELPIHEDICGALFGQKGDNLRRIKNLSGADIEVTPWCGKTATRKVRIYGTTNQINEAIGYVNEAVCAVNARNAQAVSAAAGPVVSPSYPAAVALPQPRESTQAKPAPLQRTYSSEFPSLNGNQTHSTDDSAQVETPAIISDTWIMDPPTSAVVTHRYAAMPTQMPNPWAATPPQVNAEVQNTSVVPVSPSLSSSAVDRGSMIMKAHWCLLKDRLTLVREIRDAVAIFWDVKAQESRANALSGVKFGIRSKSWAHFVTSKTDPSRDEPVDLSAATFSNMSLSRAFSSNILVEC